MLWIFRSQKSLLLALSLLVLAFVFAFLSQSFSNHTSRLHVFGDLRNPFSTLESNQAIQGHEAEPGIEGSQILKDEGQLDDNLDNFKITNLATFPESDKSRLHLSDYWTAQHGRFLPSNHILISQDRRYTFSMDDVGEYFVHRRTPGAAPKRIWWSNNGEQWLGEKWGEMTEDGFFISISSHESNKDAKDALMWSTSSWAACRNPPKEGQMAALVLTDIGGLEILHLNKQVISTDAGLSWKDWPNDSLQPKTICEIFAGDPDVKAQEDMGRLAVVLAGAMRTYQKTCESMNTKIFDKWPGSGGVDVFVSTLDDQVWDEGQEDDQPVDWNVVEQNLKTCFGDRFKVLEHKPAKSHTFPGEDETGECKDGKPESPETNLNVHYHVHRGGQLVLKYMIAKGVQYNYVLRMRPDHLVWGDAIPPFQPLDNDVLLYPMPYWELLIWSTVHTGESQLIPSDQVAFGRYMPMSIYFSLYNSYVELLKVSQLPGAVSSPPCYEPTNPCPYKTQWPCFIEGLSGYWPRLHGIRIILDWRWKMNLLRRDGKLAKDWWGPYNRTQDTRLVNTAYD